ncbi:hypothetical protein [Streptomyces sp. H39-S7]|uniref:hypothetical protein n=1 Tax=Streptomyces sp. H39-S7 TaxID=3004357 RepID=UPI0022AF4942|nr:hypothetical protein [Streptomyces sp. H39-S7]MCZ4118787.1 hypothetical protein [Streptomyces sp. H39-S7]
MSDEAIPEVGALAVDTAKGRAQFAYRAWLDHVMGCKVACRADGVDCETAAQLRQALRDARGEATP